MKEEKSLISRLLDFVPFVCIVCIALILIIIFSSNSGATKTEDLIDATGMYAITIGDTVYKDNLNMVKEKRVVLNTGRRSICTFDDDSYIIFDTNGCASYYDKEDNLLVMGYLLTLIKKDE